MATKANLDDYRKIHLPEGTRQIGSKEHLVAALEAIRERGSERKDGACVCAEVELEADLCRAILRYLNDSNIRRIDLRYAADYEQDLRAGEFRACYDPIVFRKDWSLMNGQTRLRAAAGSGMALPGCIVVFGGEDDARKSIDAGRKRTILQTHGIAGDLASCAITVIALERQRAQKWSRTLVATFAKANQELLEHYVEAAARRCDSRDGRRYCDRRSDFAGCAGNRRSHSKATPRRGSAQFSKGKTAGSDDDSAGDPSQHSGC